MMKSRLIRSALLSASLFTATAVQAQVQDTQFQDNQVQDNGILSILARQAETPSRSAPTTIPYSYTMAVDMTLQEGKEIENHQAVLRIDPSQPAGSRAQIISMTDPENETFVEFLEEIENPETEMTERAEDFWCKSGIEETEFNPTDYEVISQTETEATIKPKTKRLAELLMQSDNTEDMDKQERKMMKKLRDRVDGQMTLTKPNADLKSFHVKMTRPMTMQLVAKVKVMDVEHNCALAPNGFYHRSSMSMNVEGKALGSKFVQKTDIRFSDLTPLP